MCTRLLDRKNYSNNHTAIYSFNIFCLCFFSETKIFIINIAWSVIFDFLNISGFVIEDYKIRECACLTYSNKFEKYASIYLFKILSKTDYSSFLI